MRVSFTVKVSVRVIKWLFYLAIVRQLKHVVEIRHSRCLNSIPICSNEQL